MKKGLDYALFPLLLCLSLGGTIALLQNGYSHIVATVVPIGLLGVISFVLERVYPERPGQNRPDFPLWMEVGHFLIGIQVGYGLAILLCDGTASVVHRVIALPAWPTHWPLALQLLVTILAYEGTSYWQHRAFHRSRRLWPFHALHHAGSRLNMTRGLRFHAFDILVPTFVGYGPLIVLGAPKVIITFLGVVISVFGILQHANFRMRTPRWLDLIVCTPVMHRQHHALSREISESNYCTTVMLWDLVFGTYRPTGSLGCPQEGPAEIGIEDDHVPRTFLRQLTSPFKTT